MLFLDESGNTRIPKQPDPDSNHFAFGGVVIRSRQWSDARDQTHDTRSQHRVGGRGELKWRDLIRGTGPFSRLTEQERLRWYEDLFRRLGNRGLATGIVVVVKKLESSQRPYIRTPEDIYRRGFRYCLQRFLLYLSDNIDGEAAMVIGDQRSPGQDAALQRHYDNLMAAHERWATDRGLAQVGRVVEGLLLQRSHHSPGLQLADLIVGGVNQAFRRGDMRWLDAAKPVLRKGPGGQIDGYGLVIAQ